MKYAFEVTGMLANGERFIGGCIAYDIARAIQLFRDNGYSIHTVNNRIQVHDDSEIGIVYVHPCLYFVEEYLPLTETFVAKQMYELFSHDDLENFCKVRKQILKGLKVDYFQKK